MEISTKFAEKWDRLDYLAAMLRSLANMGIGASSPLLMYFLDLAAAQARHEASLAKEPIQGRQTLH